MQIGIVGSGMIGGTAAGLFTGAGHEVAISNSRGPESLASLVETLGPRARAVTVEEAATFGEIVLLAIPFGKYQALLVPPFAGKIVVDATNYYAQRDGQIAFGGLTSSELIARHLSGALLVKAFNTIYFRDLATLGRTDLPLSARRAIFVAGDAAGAKQRVVELVEQIGFAAVDTGSLHEGGRKQEPGSPLYNQPLMQQEALALVSSRPLAD